MKKLSSHLGLINRSALCTVLCLSGLALAIFAVRGALAQGPASGTPAIQGINRGLSPVVKFDVSPPLRAIQIAPLGPGQISENEDREIMPMRVRFAPEWDPVVQPTLGRGAGNGTEIPGPIVSFNAQPNVNGVVPPDPNAALVPTTLSRCVT